MVKVGLDVLFEEQRALIRGKCVGLVTNQTGVDGQLRSNVALFAAQQESQLVALFGPEHGIWGNAQDAVVIPSTTDVQRRIPIYSLYGETRKPTQEMLTGIDVLVYDIQDIGARFYTYISTLLLAMEAATEHAVDFIVLDRPNPIRGDRLEGNLLQPAFKSFVGSHPIPIRHGMTVGELASFFKAELNLGVRLQIVPIRGWSRSMWYDQIGLVWVPPSPNMPTIDTAMLYPGTCFIEGTNLSEGRGTTKPFEWIGAPWIDADAWAGTLNSLEMPGVRFRPVHFTPAFSKYADEQCHGVCVHVINRDTAKPIEIGLHLITTLQVGYRDHFEFRQNRGRFFFDLLAGTDQLRLALSEGQSPTEIVQNWCAELQAFENRRAQHLLYT